jgi:CHASE2 domain-containing sensor protein
MEKGAVRALALAVFVGLAFGVLQLGQPLDNAMKIGRNKLREHPASGTIVLVAIDDRSLAEVGPYPWNDAQLADLVEWVHAAGARRIHLDVDLPTDGPPQDMSRLEAVLSGIGENLFLPARFDVDPVSKARSDHLPPARFSRHARLVNTNLRMNWDDKVWLHPYGAEVNGNLLPSLASVL